MSQTEFNSENFASYERRDAACRIISKNIAESDLKVTGDDLGKASTLKE